AGPMAGGRFETYAEPCGDDFGGEAIRKEAQHLSLPRGQGRWSGMEGGCLSLAGNYLHRYRPGLIRNNFHFFPRLALDNCDFFSMTLRGTDENSESYQ